jgi:hypothetical protein
MDYCLKFSLKFIDKFGKFPMNYTKIQLTKTFITIFNDYLLPF